MLKKIIDYNPNYGNKEQFVHHDEILRLQRYRQTHPSSWLKLRIKCFQLVTHVYFDQFIMICIILNIIAMACEYNGMNMTYQHVLQVIEYIFYSIFCIEMILKLLGLGIRQYFYFKWNQFDFLIVVTATIQLIIEAVSSNNPTSATASSFDPSLFRIFRIFRILRLIKQAQGIKDMINTLILSSSALFNVSMLLFLLFFVFSIAGMNLFGTINQHIGNYITEYNNFATWTNSMLLLFRIATGESWNGIMNDCSIMPPYCVLADNNCGSPKTASLYFPIFVCLSSFLLLNVFIAVVLSNFEAQIEKKQDQTDNKRLDRLDRLDNSGTKANKPNNMVVNSLKT